MYVPLKQSHQLQTAHIKLEDLAGGLAINTVAAGRYFDT